MSEGTAKMMVLVGEKFACVKISGRANFTSSVDFKALLVELQREGRNYFVLDLSECALMDSTFLGVLAGFGVKLGGPNEGPCGPGIVLLNANARIIELLESLGVLHLFRVTDGPMELPAHLHARDVIPASPTKNDITRACLEAHQTLMDINAANVPKFKDVTQYLTEKLKASRPS